MKLLFICTGNTCRSSMAEALARTISQELGHDSFEIASAGLAAFPGDRASREAVQAMEERDIDLSRHRARPIQVESLKDANLILTMTERHKQQILALFPDTEGKVFTLKEFAEIEGGIDVSDPFGQPLEVYRLCAQEIEEALRKALPKVVFFLNGKGN